LPNTWSEFPDARTWCGSRAVSGLDRRRFDARAEKNGAGKRDAWPEVERAARALNRSNLAIYPVDARGLMVGQQYVGSMMKPELRNPDTSEFATMQMLAERTGGRAFFNNNDLAAALHQAADDARVTYVLGYYASHHDWKGRSGNLSAGGAPGRGVALPPRLFRAA